MNWLIWQYGDNGTVSGINGGVDVDRFNGTRQDLERFVGQMPDYAAAYVAQSFPLASSGMTMSSGDIVAAYIDLKNVGAKAWDENTRLATSEPRDRVSLFGTSSWLTPARPAAVVGTVAPGATYRFQFELRAPATPGTYDEFFGMVQEGVAWFSDSDQGGPPDRQLENKIQVISAGPVVSPPSKPPSNDAGMLGPTQGPGTGGSSGNGLNGIPTTATGGTDGDVADASTSQGATAHAGREPEGCGCRVVVQRSTKPRALWMFAALCLLLRRRSKRHSPDVRRPRL
jgi:hypothetical protein